MKRGTKLVCIKQMTDYRTENEVDFFADKEYPVVSCEGSEVYVESEDGSDVLFETGEDFYEYFNVVE